MNVALILAGGTGTRIGGPVPKQYQMVQDKPLFVYCLETFEQHPQVDSILVIAAEEWQEFLHEWIDREKISKFAGFAPAGRSRQESVFNGLLQAKQNGVMEEDVVIVHDAVRPCVSGEMLSACITALEEAEGAMPVIPIKDTVYQSRDGKRISSLLNRDELYAGQAPEGFRFGKYYEAHVQLGRDALGAIRGSSEIAYESGMKICLFPGAESNYKITTPEDLEKFRQQTAGRQQ